LRKLRPVLIGGVLRIGGRLQNSDLPFDERHPILLPRRHHVTELAVHHYHAKVGHCGTQYVLAATRETFWIVHGHSTVRYDLKDCRKCRLSKARACGKVMAPLPKCSVTSGARPFTCAGVDYFVPQFAKVGRSHVKRYGCLFTCMASRAVHVEVAHSITASSFLQAFVRFVQRRGTVRKIYSDCGLNFLSAERELRGVKQWNQQTLHESLRQKGVEWLFNPPFAPTSGDAWEILVKVVKQILKL